MGVVAWSDLPKGAVDDPFCPPEQPCQVRCLHCGQEYSSDRIIWRPEGDQGFWCCPVEGCGGMGFGFDIFPVDAGIWDDEPDEECGLDAEDQADEDEPDGS